MHTTDIAVPRYVHATKWIWLIGTAVTLVTTIVAAVLYPLPAVWVMLGVTVVQAAFAIPAALTLTRRKRWARITLMILAALSIGSLYTALQMQAWPTLVLNLVLAMTLGFLQDPSVRTFFGLPRDPWLRRRFRGTSN